MDERRIRLTVRYDGTEFAGSQVQPGRRTVAGTLTDELESLMGTRPKLLFAGRTDAGVHAEGNVCCFAAAELRVPLHRLAATLNARLPLDLRVRDAAEAAPGFHPRYSARRRTYVYRIWRGTDVPIDRLRYTAQHLQAWDRASVDRALQSLLGRHDFSAFGRGVASGRGACELLAVRQTGRGAETALRFTADRFLWQMVRRIAAGLMEIAAGRRSPDEFALALESHQDLKLRPAPARGLTLLEVRY